MFSMEFKKELQISYFINSYQKAYYNILFTANWIDLLSQKELKKFDLTLPQYNVLRILSKQEGKKLNAVDIQKRMLHKTSNVTRLLDKLEEKKLILRQDDKENFRIRNVSLTKSGLRLIQKTEFILMNQLNSFQEIMTEEEADLLSENLDLLREKISQMKEPKNHVAINKEVL